MKNLTNNEYSEMVKRASPPSRSYKTIPMSFLVGGAICTLGHALIRLYLGMGMEQELAYPVASITLMFFSVLLTGFQLYDKLASIGYAGTLVPITGFANSIASPAVEFKSEGFVLGLGAKLFTISGSVIIYGIVAGVIYGIVLYVFKLY